MIKPFSQTRLGVLLSWYFAMNSEKLLLNFIYLFDVHLQSSNVDTVLFHVGFHLLAFYLGNLEVIVELLPSVAEVIGLQVFINIKFG